MSVNSNRTSTVTSKLTAHGAMHPILNSVVHHSFRSASKDVGCCEFAEQDFIRALDSHVPTLRDAFRVQELDLHRLWASMMAGEVIAVEFEAGTLLFHVQGRVLGSYVDMRFAYRKDVWTIRAVTSVHTRPFWRSRLLITAAASVAGMLLTGLVGYSVAVQRSPVSRQTVESWASLHGYTLVQNRAAAVAASSAGSHIPVGSPTNSTSADTSTNTSSTHGTAKTASHAAQSHAALGTKKPPAAPQNFQFDFTSSMTVHDISVFLQQHHLVHNAYDFDQVLAKTGIQKHIWPGTYTFNSQMNASQILQELQSGPKS